MVLICYTPYQADGLGPRIPAEADGTGGSFCFAGPPAPVVTGSVNVRHYETPLKVTSKRQVQGRRDECPVGRERIRSCSPIRVIYCPGTRIGRLQCPRGRKSSNSCRSRICGEIRSRHRTPRSLMRNSCASILGFSLWPRADTHIILKPSVYAILTFRQPRASQHAIRFSTRSDKPNYTLSTAYCSKHRGLRFTT